MKMQLKQKLDILLIAGNGPSLAALVNYCALLVIWSNSYFIPSTILFQGFPLNIFTKTFALFLNIINWHGIKFWNYHWARWMQLWKLQKRQFTNNHTKGLQGLHLALNNIRKKKKKTARRGVGMNLLNCMHGKRYVKHECDEEFWYKGEVKRKNEEI